MSTRTVESVRGLQLPTNLTEHRSFLELCNVIPSFALIFSRVAISLNKKLLNDQLQTFDGMSDEEITALETLKAKLIEPTVLPLPQSQGDYTVGTEACDKQIGCIILQKQPARTGRPIGTGLFR